MINDKEVFVEMLEGPITPAMFTAFCYGMALALASHNKSITDYRDVLPILKKMEKVATGKSSMVRMHDDTIEQAFAMKKLEKELCQIYLEKVAKKSNDENN